MDLLRVRTEVPVEGRPASASVELFFGFAPRDLEQTLAELLKRAERAAGGAKDLRQPWVEWTPELGSDEIVNWRRKRAGCGASTSWQVRKRKVAEPQSGLCANCGSALPITVGT